MRNGFYFGICLFLVLMSFTPAWAQEELDLGKCIEVGLRDNESINAARAQILGAEHGIISAKGAFGPALSTDYGYTRLDEKPTYLGMTAGDQDNWQLHFNIKQPLFTGFALLSNYEKAVLQKEAAEQSLRLAELSLILSIQQNFLSLLQARENVKSEQDSLTRLQSHLKVIKAFHDVGLRPKLDVLQSQVDVATAEQALLAAQTHVDIQEARLNSLLNFAINKKGKYTGKLAFTPFSLDLNSCLHLAMQNRPDLMLAGKSIDVAQQNVRLVGSDLYPQVAANFDYTRSGDDFTVSGSKYQDESQWQVSLGMEWKFFEWGKTMQAKKQAEKNVMRLISEYENQKKEAEYEVTSNFLKIQEAAKQIAVARKALEAARESYRMATARYQAQVGTNTDVLDAQATVTKGEAAVTRALAAYSQAIASLYFSMGEKNTDLSMR